MSTPPHTHSSGKCPVTGASGADPHAFCPAQEGDSRAPCPAMNSMANHGYLPRDGKGVTADIIVDALMAAFRLSKPLAWALTHGALLLLDQGSAPFELHDLARHNKVEHNASLYHPNAGPREEYAPLHGDAALLKEFFATSKDGRVMTAEDVARVRVRREAATPIDFVHAELARGEMAIVLNMFNNPDAALHDEGVPLQPRSSVSSFVRSLFGYKDTGANRQLDGVPIERMQYWFEHERLPPDWTPYHETTLLETIGTINRLRSAMSAMRKTGEGQVQGEGEVEAEDTAKAPAKSVEVEAAKVGQHEEEDVSDDENAGGVPSLSHSRSATSETFSLPPTPQTSQFVTPPLASKGKGVDGIATTNDLEPRIIGKELRELEEIGSEQVVGVVA
ncbi:chloroperoxidase [Phanerochaete sordida]|uniref:Chloroperoxidase n=1 Tax=Phanerochaete sordida TaxID=48140 RepID=A0A9P3GM40_9APHY|nr:chloroperoxidase [Phanerochaete sordida]